VISEESFAAILLLIVWLGCDDAFCLIYYAVNALPCAQLGGFFLESNSGASFYILRIKLFRYDLDAAMKVQMNIFIV